MKILFTALLLFLANTSLADEVILSCTGDFEHSETVKVEVSLNLEAKEVLTETLKSEETLSKEVSETEFDACEYVISPIFGVERVIKRTDQGWVISYDCGEDRPITCITSERFCIRQ